MLPFMAQGAVMAIEDAVLLARVIESHRDDLATAIGAYESLRVERANRCVRAADRNRRRQPPRRTQCVRYLLRGGNRLSHALTSK